MRVYVKEEAEEIRNDNKEENGKEDREMEWNRWIKDDGRVEKWRKRRGVEYMYTKDKEEEEKEGGVIKEKVKNKRRMGIKKVKINIREREGGINKGDRKEYIMMKN